MNDKNDSSASKWALVKNFETRLGSDPTSTTLVLELKKHRTMQHPPVYSVTLGKRFKSNRGDGAEVFVPHLPVNIKRENGRVKVTLYTKELAELLAQAQEHLTNEEQIAYDLNIEDRQSREASRDRVPAQRPGLKELAKRDRQQKTSPDATVKQVIDQGDEGKTP